MDAEKERQTVNDLAVDLFYVTKHEPESTRGIERISKALDEQWNAAIDEVKRTLLGTHVGAFKWGEIESLRRKGSHE